MVNLKPESNEETDQQGKGNHGFVLEARSYVRSRVAGALCRAYGRRSIAGIIKNYFDDSYLSAVSSFVKEEKISVDELRELINQIEKQQS